MASSSTHTEKMVKRTGSESPGSGDEDRSTSPTRRRGPPAKELKDDLEGVFDQGEDAPRETGEKTEAEKRREERQREFDKLREQREGSWEEDCKYCDSGRKLAESTCIACEKDPQETRQEYEERQKRDAETAISEWSAQTFKRSDRGNDLQDTKIAGKRG